MSSPPGEERASASLRPAQLRIITTATELFARYGVAGTSLQMIADEIGVTKAAVYHQYNSKDEIILAAAEAELATLAEVVERAAAHPTPAEARDALIAGMVELTVRRRHAVGTVLRDPVIVDFFANHDTYRAVMHRLRQLLVGDDAGSEARVEVAMLIAAISGASMHPFVIDLDDDTLREHLLRLARRFLGLPA